MMVRVRALRAVTRTARARCVDIHECRRNHLPSRYRRGVRRTAARRCNRGTGSSRCSESNICRAPRQSDRRDRHRAADHPGGPARSRTRAGHHLGGSLGLVAGPKHSGCGAATVAVDVFMNPRACLSLAAKPSLRSILDRLLLVVHAAARRTTTIFGQEVTRRRGCREALIEVAIVPNAALSAHTAQQETGSGDPHALRAAHGVYLVSNRQIRAPCHGIAGCGGRAFAPLDVAGFDEFGDAVVRSDRIASLLR
jgi:hypothetical protein